MTQPKPLVKHVTILGRAEVYTPIPPGEVWGLNGTPRTAEEWSRLTRQFQIHPYHILPKGELDALKSVKVPTYTIRSSPQYPHTIPYPLSSVPRGTFASSFDYMMALAIWEGFTSILLTGIDYQNGTLRERLCEHVSLAYWVGLARGGGISVQISKKSTLLKFPWRYGYDYLRERRWGQAQGRAALKEGMLDDGGARHKLIKGIVPSGRLIQVGRWPLSYTVRLGQKAQKYRGKNKLGPASLKSSIRNP